MRKSSVFAELSVWSSAEPNLKFGQNSSAEPVPNRKFCSSLIKFR